MRGGGAIDRVVGEGGLCGVVCDLEFCDEACGIWQGLVRPFQRREAAGQMLQRWRARRVAQCCALHAADDGAQIFGGAAHGDAGVLQHREQQHWVSGRCHPARQDQQEAARRGAGERHAGGGRDVDAPALEDRGGAARERGFGGYEGRGLVGCLQRLAQEEGGGEGFFAFVFGFDEGEALQGFGDEIARRGGRGERFEAAVPVAGFGGGREGFVDEAAAGALGGDFRFDGPGADVGGLQAERDERCAEGVLRVAGGGGD